MTNAELITELIYHASIEKRKLLSDAADALEAAEKRIAVLEAQMPKEGEWIEANTRPRSAQFYCSVCHRTCYDIQPTRDKVWTKRCRYNYCPNCGAKMDGETEHGNTYSLGKIEMPKGAMKKIIADGERKDGEHE